LLRPSLKRFAWTNLRWRCPLAAPLRCFQFARLEPQAGMRVTFRGGRGRACDAILETHHPRRSRAHLWGPLGGRRCRPDPALEAYRVTAEMIENTLRSHERGLEQIRREDDP
jgi:hypothetical protein